MGRPRLVPRDANRATRLEHARRILDGLPLAGDTARAIARGRLLRADMAPEHVSAAIRDVELERAAAERAR